MSNLLRRALVGTAALVFVTAGGARAQEVPLPGIDNTAFGTTSAEFLLLGAGARGSALGGAFASIATDVTALYWNPGGLAQMERPGATISVYEYVAGTKYSWAGLAFPFNDGATAIGFQAASFGFSDQPIYTLSNPDGDGSTYKVSESFFGLTLSQNFSDRFSAGLTGKIITDHLGQTSATAAAVDFGTSFHALVGGRPLRASFVLQNLGTTLRHQGVGLNIGAQRPAPPQQQELPQDPQPARYQTEEFGLPVIFRVGIAYDFFNSMASRVTVLSEFTQPNNSDPSAGGGLEWAFTDIGRSGFSFMARGSYTYQPDNDFSQDPTSPTYAGFTTGISSDSDLDGLAVGGGIMYNRGSFALALDYAYRYLGVLGGTNVFSASVNW